MPQDPKDVETANRIAPACVAFTEAMAAEGLVTSALIFDPEGSFLIRAGNAPHEGPDFVRLHYYLALTISLMHAAGDYSDISMKSAPTGQNPADIAAELALAVITVPSDMMHERVRTLAEQYLKTVGA